MPEIIRICENEMKNSLVWRQPTSVGDSTKPMQVKEPKVLEQEH